MPTLAPWPNRPASHSAMEGVPAMRSFISTKGVPANCSSAARKYRLSVHSAASSRPTTAVPALPLNPLIHSRVFQCEGTYSPLCGSELGKIKASSPRSLKNVRKRSTRSTILFFSIFIDFFIIAKIPLFSHTRQKAPTFFRLSPHLHGKTRPEKPIIPRESRKSHKKSPRKPGGKKFNSFRPSVFS